MCVVPLCILTNVIIWATDKEVLGYYEDGMTVPDDVMLLWSDDKCVSRHTVCPLVAYSSRQLRQYPSCPDPERTQPDRRLWNLLSRMWCENQWRVFLLTTVLYVDRLRRSS